MASLFFEPHPLNLVHIHFFLTCMHAIILSLLSQAVSDLAKSVLFVTGGVLALVYKPYVKEVTLRQEYMPQKSCHGPRLLAPNRHV